MLTKKCAGADSASYLSVTERSSSPNSSLNVACYNCEGFLSSADYIVSLLTTCDIIFLSETWLSRAEEAILSRVLADLRLTDCYCVQEFSMEFPPGAGEGRRHGGVAIICRNRYGMTCQTIACGDSRLCGITVSDAHGPRLTVFGCYMPFWATDGHSLEDYAQVIGKLDALVSALHSSAPVLILGDFNCQLPKLPQEQRPQSWSLFQGFTPLSLSMQHFLDEHGFIIAEFYFPQSQSFTYQRGGHRTHIDHIAVPSTFLEDVIGCNIVNQCAENLSPHSPISITISLSPPLVSGHVSLVSQPDSPMTKPDVLRWDCTQNNIMFKSALERRLSYTLKHTGKPVQLDDFDKSITQCIHAAARESGCARPRRPPKPWWTPSISVQRDRARFWHRIWTDCGRPFGSAVQRSYSCARRAYRLARRRAARSTIDQEARLLHFLRRNRKVPSFWRQVTRVRRGKRHTLSKHNAQDFADHFKSVHSSGNSELTPNQKWIRDLVASRFAAGCESTKPRLISTLEVAALIPRLKRGGAPGQDLITAEHLVYGQCEALLTAIAQLLSACFQTSSVPKSFTSGLIIPVLKKPYLDPNSLDNYRPISLTSIMSKLLELIILDELRDAFVPHELQFGFAQNRGTVQASLLTAETVQWHLRRKLPVFVANLDARKCFDSIWHDGLFFRLLVLLGTRSWCLLRAWYFCLSAQVCYGGVTSHSFKIDRGTRQGAILSPTLANVYFRPLVELLDDADVGARLLNAHVPAICYADDLLLISTNVKYLDKMLGIVDQFASHWMLEFVSPNQLKTKSHCIVFGGQQLSRLPVWCLSGQKLKVHNVTEHLGAIVSSDLSGTPHALHRIKRARSAFYGLTPAGMFNKNLSPADKAFLWKTVALPTLCFGCEISALKLSDISMLEHLQSMCIKASLGLPRFAHHSALLAALNIPTVQVLLRQSVLNGLAGSFCSQHRLYKAYVRGLALLACSPTEMQGSVLGFGYTLLNNNFEQLLRLSIGHVEESAITEPSAPDGLVDTLRFLAQSTCPASRRLLRLLVVNTEPD